MRGGAADTRAQSWFILSRMCACPGWRARGCARACGVVVAVWCAHGGAASKAARDHLPRHIHITRAGTAEGARATPAAITTQLYKQHCVLGVRAPRVVGVGVWGWWEWARALGQRAVAAVVCSVASAVGGSVGSLRACGSAHCTCITGWYMVEATAMGERGVGATPLGPVSCAPRFFRPVSHVCVIGQSTLRAPRPPPLAAPRCALATTRCCTAGFAVHEWYGGGKSGAFGGWKWAVVTSDHTCLACMAVCMCSGATARPGERPDR